MKNSSDYYVKHVTRKIKATLLKENKNKKGFRRFVKVPNGIMTNIATLMKNQSNLAHKDTKVQIELTGPPCEWRKVLPRGALTRSYRVNRKASSANAKELQMRYMKKSCNLITRWKVK